MKCFYCNAEVRWNNDYDTELSIPEEWKSMFDNIDLTSIQHFLATELGELGDYIPIYPPKQLVLNAFKITTSNTKNDTFGCLYRCGWISRNRFRQWHKL